MYSASGKYGEIGVSVVYPEADDCNGKIKRSGHITHPVPKYYLFRHSYHLAVYSNHLQFMFYQ